jgi:hypothetical protein
MRPEAGANDLTAMLLNYRLIGGRTAVAHGWTGTASLFICYSLLVIREFYYIPLFLPVSSFFLEMDSLFKLSLLSKQVETRSGALPNGVSGGLQSTEVASSHA